mmetsp:Transcript_3962/g.9076  ORF Transcript_3962/g.9076 Transcript_3962/m.9076 type:complete len:406 (+) Transcript_3962:72-1289(+)
MTFPCSAMQKLASISFSGAGFLGCYHMGAAACLLDQGYLLCPDDIPRNEGENSSIGASSPSYPAITSPPILTGVSAGSIVSAALSAGVTPDTGMSTVIEIAQRTRDKGGTLDILRPGFSLVDQVEDLLRMNMKRALGGTGNAADDYDRELFLKRIRGGRNLRIGLTDKRKLPIPGVIRDLPEAYRYIDQYRDVDDVVAACVLSSYIPGITGTLRGATCPMNDAVKRSWGRVHEMERLGYVKDGITGQQVAGTATDEPSDLYYWDGGLADVFPTIDDSTVIVSPINGKYSNPSISPPWDRLSEDGENQVLTGSKGDVGNVPPTSLGKTGREDAFTDLIIKRSLAIFPLTVQAHALASLGINTENAETLFRMMWSSDSEVLEERFRCGFDDAHRFLEEKSLLRTFRN